MNRLKELRQINNLTQPQFGELFWLSKFAVSYIENGTKRLKRDLAEQIAEHFKIETDWLLGASRVPVKRTIKPYVPPERPKIRIDDSYIWRR